MLPYSVNLDSGYNWGGILVVLFIIGVFAGPIWLCMLLRYYDAFTDWWDSLFGTGYYDNKTYNTGNTTKTTTTKTTKTKTTWGKKADEWGLYEDDRKEPPKATFFCRFDNEERSEDGPWEEIYLSARELAGWNNKKRQKVIITDKNNTKSDLLDESRAFQEQYDSTVGYRG